MVELSAHPFVAANPSDGLRTDGGASVAGGGGAGAGEDSICQGGVAHFADLYYLETREHPPRHSPGRRAPATQRCRELGALVPM